ncbi:MAG: pancreas/duodenum homeobox protein 1 [Proteobacteria bacterium]|nr:pancreas/duodenum homeobox protein 1 [Pseudomonadota bacterium]MBU1714864.1 pancreas/duodenum homeobox protein 1 [Pseudomonadota bacterium]
MSAINFKDIFTGETMEKLFPGSRANEFFDALYGDIEEGVYDISLEFESHSPADNTLLFNLNLTERPGKCLACNLTYGLPQVFSRHPIINLQGVVNEIDQLLAGKASCGEWSLGNTRPTSKKLSIIPLVINLK